jgi:hypothetical protein
MGCWWGRGEDMPYETLHLISPAGASMPHAERCMELLDLAPGWLDGEGLPPSRKLLEQVGEWLEAHQHNNVQQPRLFPTPEGGVEAEWRIGRLDLSIAFDPSSATAEWHALDLDQGTVDEQRVALQDKPGMQALGFKLQRVLACRDQICEA